MMTITCKQTHKQTKKTLNENIYFPSTVIEHPSSVLCICIIQKHGCVLLLLLLYKEYIQYNIIQ